MSNIKSSVEHFWEQLEERGFQETEGVNTINISIDVNEYLALKQQAKAMHKTEHFNTWWHGISENEPITFEQYYNEHYGK